MIDTIDPGFSAGLRRALVATANRPEQRRYRSLRSWLIGGLTIALVASASVAAGVLIMNPGGEMVTPIGPRITASATGSGTIALGASPPGAAAVEYEFECLTTGTFTFGATGPSISCAPNDVGEGSARGSGQLQLTLLVDGLLVVTTNSSSEWTMTAWYVAAEPLPLATNANGETYGTDAFEANPDLIAAQATNGEVGYVRATELEAVGGPEPTSPSEAAEITREREGRIYVVPVYESDGITVIGQFEIGS